MNQRILVHSQCFLQHGKESTVLFKKKGSLFGGELTLQDVFLDRVDKLDEFPAQQAAAKHDVGQFPVKAFLSKGTEYDLKGVKGPPVGTEYDLDIPLSVLSQLFTNFLYVTFVLKASLEQVFLTKEDEDEVEPVVHLGVNGGASMSKGPPLAIKSPVEKVALKPLLPARNTRSSASSPVKSEDGVTTSPNIAAKRKFACEYCDYASATTYKLRRHILVHTGEKPFECDICHQRFTQNSSMKTHRLGHEKNRPVFQCQLCPVICSRKGDLKTHFQKMHHVVGNDDEMSSTESAAAVQEMKLEDAGDEEGGEAADQKV